MNADNNEEIIFTKIKKLLELGNSTNENEAKVATAKAQELLAKHNLDLQKINYTNSEYIEGTAGNTYIRRTPEISYIIPIIKNYFFVEAFIGFSRISKNRKLYRVTMFFGTKTNVKIAQYVYMFLLRTYEDLWRNYLKQNKKAHKKSYLTGVNQGIIENLDNTVKKVQDEKGLIIVRDPKLIDYRNKNLFNMKDLETGRLNKKDYKNGERDGLKVKILKALSNDSKVSNRNIGFN